MQSITRRIGIRVVVAAAALTLTTTLAVRFHADHARAVAAQQSARFADLCRQGDADAQAGRWDNALGDWRQALQIRPETARLHFLSGGVYMSRQEFGTAVREWRAVVRLQPTLAEAHADLGLALAYQFQTGDGGTIFPQEALNEGAQAVRLAPHSAQCHADDAYLLASRGDDDRALAQIHLALQTETHPAQKVMLYALRGRVQNESGDPAAAILSLRAAVRLDPRDPRSHLLLGHALASAGKIAEARDQWQTVLSLDHGPFGRQAQTALARLAG